MGISNAAPSCYTTLKKVVSLDWSLRGEKAVVKTCCLRDLETGGPGWAVLTKFHGSSKLLP